MNEITKKFSAITVDKVEPHAYKKGVASAQLRQTVTTTYPSVRVTNSLNDSLFSLDEFKLPEGQSYTSTRVTWLNVPEGMTAKQVQERIDAAKMPVIYRKISNKVEDVMSAEQHQAVAAGLRTIEEFQDQLRVRYVDEATGELRDVEPAQYRTNAFSTEGRADEDFRSDIVENEGKTVTTTEAKSSVPENTASTTGQNEATTANPAEKAALVL